jgi:hypothetical protein
MKTHKETVMYTSTLTHTQSHSDASDAVKWAPSGTFNLVPARSGVGLGTSSSVYLDAAEWALVRPANYLDVSGPWYFQPST